MKKGLKLFRRKNDTKRSKDFDAREEYYEDDYYEDDYYEDEDSDGDYEEDYDEEYEEDYEDEEYSQEELEEYYEKSGVRRVEEEPKAPVSEAEPVKDYEFTDEDYLDDDDYPEDEILPVDEPQSKAPDTDEVNERASDNARSYDEEPEHGSDDYEESDYEDDYYEDDGYEDDRYEDSEYDDSYYEDDEYDEEYYEKKPARKSGRGSAALFFARIGDAIASATAVERIAAVFAIILVTGAVVTATLYASAMSKNDELGAFAEVGASLDDVQVVGQSGLIAIADAQRAKMMAAELISEEAMEEQEEEPEEEQKGCEVKVTLTSIKSDIKVKFMDKESGKLIGGVPFEISVVTPDGTTVSYDDHDQDGIIYKTKLTAGTYKVTPKELPSNYSDYKLSTETLTIKVKDTVEMKAVDVKNEIKKESQINVAQEEAKGGQETESELADTVDWDGESWVKDGDGDGTTTYSEVKKEDVPEPSGSSKVTIKTLGRFSESPLSESASEELTTDEEEGGENGGGEGNTGEGNDSPGESGTIEVDEPKEISLNKTSFTLEVGEMDTIQASADATLYFETSDSSVVYVDDNGRITGAAEGTATITITAEGYKAAYVTVTVTKKEEEVIETGRVPLENYSVSMYVKETYVIKCTDDSAKCKFSSDNDSVAKVDKKGTVTAVAEGSAVITVSAKGYEDARVEVTVTKKLESAVVPIEITSLTLYEKQTKKIKVKESGLKLSFSTSDKNIAKVSDDGTITAVSKGSCKITVSAEGYEDAVIDVTVVHQELKDKDGNTLYVLESDGKYRVATYADYESYKVFYKKVENKNKIYHGWATIDGKTYFYDNSGNYVTGEQVINHVKYVFGSDGVLAKSAPTVGIDVSKHNGNIDWKAVKNSGVNFAIIRCGYRGYSTGVMVEDPTFRTNIRGALAAGLRVGVYYYSQAVDEVEAVEEASMVINLLSGYGIQLPVYMDVEASGGRGDSISVSQRTANIKAFCGTIQSAGYKAGVYANKTWLTSYINTSQISKYHIWLAQYAKEPTYSASRYDMWQYTSKGRISGISGNVDMNICY